jgi:hypothetical protein
MARAPGLLPLTLTPGMYRVIVSGGGESSWRRIWIHESQRLILTPPDPGSRRLGAGLATSGAVIGGAGSVLTLYAMMKALSCSFGSRPEDEGNSGCPGRILITLGLGGMATGLALGISGIVLLVRHSRPRVDFEPYRGNVAGPPSLYLALGSGHSPAGLSLGASF